MRRGIGTQCSECSKQCRVRLAALLARIQKPRLTSLQREKIASEMKWLRVII